MAKYLPKTPSKKPKVTSFLGCFGYSLENIPKSYSNSKKNNKVGCWFKFPNKKSVAKTVPVDGSNNISSAATAATAVDSEKAEARKKSNVSKLSWKRKSDGKPVTRDLSEVATLKTMKTVKVSSNGLRKTRSKTAQISVQQQKEKRSESAQNPTCQIKQLLSQNIQEDEALLSEPNRPASPDHLKPKTIRTTSVSSQPPSRTESRKIKQEVTGSTRLDPLMGMSIILIILLIMVLWGRLCAILCTSAWFYFIPKLRSTMIRSDRAMAAAESNSPNPHDNLDLNSEEYKKKVVLEGFLERNRRNSSL